MSKTNEQPFQNFLEDKFSGLDPEDIIFLMTLPDPETSVSSKVAQTIDAALHSGIFSEFSKKY